jgi:hypothetical protein
MRRLIVSVSLVTGLLAASASLASAARPTYHDQQPKAAPAALSRPSTATPHADPDAPLEKRAEEHAD